MNVTTSATLARARRALHCEVLAALLACACARGESAPALHLALRSADADVWSYELDIDGELREANALERCVVRVNRAAYSARVLRRRALHAKVKLAPGMNDVHAECRTADGRSVRSQTLHERVRLSATPRALAQVTRTASGVVLDATSSKPSAADAAPLTHYAWYKGPAPAQNMSLGAGARLQLPTAKPGDLFTLQITDAQGRTDVARTMLDANVARAAHDRAAIVYGILPPLYGSPPLQHVSAALERLAALGVDTLWLAPLFTTTPDDFGYAVSDYFTVRADYGTARDLHALVAHAHALGLRVLLDLPANHTSDQHPYFIQARELHAHSHYYDFYAREDDGGVSHYFDWENLPNLNYQTAEVSRFMLAVADHWLQTSQIDGFRLDAAWGVRERDPSYWPQFGAEVRRILPTAMLVAEASARDPYYREPLFDAAYDWTAELGKHSWEHVFDSREGVAMRLAEALRASPDIRPSPSEPRVRVLRFLNNNDTGERFIARHGPEMTRVATAALLTLPGIPCLYSFDEVGAAFLPYEALTPIAHDDPALRAFHERWIGLRRSVRALTGDATELVHVGDAGAHDEVLAYVRADGEARALVVLNFSARPIQLALELPRRLWPAARARDVASDKPAAVRGERLPLRLGAWDARVFLPDPR
jgi:glycosidase